MTQTKTAADAGSIPAGSTNFYKFLTQLDEYGQKIIREIDLKKYFK